MSKVKFNSEKDLEDAICEFIEEYGKCPLTNNPVTHWYRQVKIGSYGVADIVKIYIGGHGYIEVTVLELKNEELTVNSIAQVSRYSSGISHFISKKFKKLESYITVNSELLGAGFKESDDLCFLHNQLNDLISIYTFDLSVSKGFYVREIANKWRRDHPEFNDDGSEIIDDIRISVKESISTLVDSDNKK